MTAPKKTEFARQWLAIEDQLAEEEAKRVAGMSEAQLLAELEDDGFDASGIPSADELMDRVTARAQRNRASTSPDASAKVLPRGSRPRRGVAETAIPDRRPSRLPLVVAAALAAMVLLLIWVKRHDIEARIWGPEIRPDNEHAPYVTPPSKLAQKLRDEAETACVLRDWDDCRAKLDQARQLDPAGEDEERVQGMRKGIDAWEHPKPVDPDEELRRQHKTGQ